MRAIPLPRALVKALVILAVLFAFVTPASAAEDKSVYTLGVFPYLSPTELESVFSHIAEDFSRVTGKKVLLRTNSTFKKYQHSLMQGKFDITLLQPFDYIVAADKLGYIPLATRDDPLRAIFVIKNNMDYRSAKDIKGKRLALPPESAAVSILAKHYLRKSGIDLKKDLVITYHRSHTSCLQQVLIGEADFCATAWPALQFFEKRMKTKLIVADKSSKIPHALFAVHPRVPEPMREMLKKRILSWHDYSDGKNLLKSIRLSRFRPTSDKEYDIVRELSR